MSTSRRSGRMVGEELPGGSKRGDSEGIEAVEQGDEPAEAIAGMGELRRDLFRDQLKIVGE